MALRFTLQNVLDFRHIRVETHQIELGKLLAELGKVEKRIDDLNHFRMMFMKKLEAGLQGDLNMVEVDFTRSDIRLADELIKQAEAERVKLTQAVTAKRSQMVTARQDEEALNILKKKLTDEYNQNQAMVEAHAQDEVYIARAYRDHVSGG